MARKINGVATKWIINDKYMVVVCNNVNIIIPHAAQPEIPSVNKMKGFLNPKVISS
jgi:hypothetical protein